MKVGLVGTGLPGSAIAEPLAHGDSELRLATRDLADAEKAAIGAGASAHAGTIDAVIEASDA